MSSLVSLFLVSALGMAPVSTYEHLSCSAFVALEESQRVMYTKGFIAGIGATIGVLDMSVRAVERKATHPKEAEAAKPFVATVAKLLLRKESDESIAKSIAVQCAQPEYSSGSAVKAAIDFLIKGQKTSAQWLENGKPMPDKPWAKSDGDFGAMLAYTDKPDELYAAWEKPSPGVKVSETSTAVRGIPIVGVVVFTGCAANPGGKCDLVARFTTFTPSGKQWGDPVDADIWVGLPPPEVNTFQLSHGHIGLIVEPGDELGVYTTKVELTDRVSKKNMKLERQFTAVEAPEKE